MLKRRQRAGVAVDTDDEDRRLGRDARDGVRGQPARNPVRLERRHDRDPGRKRAHDLEERVAIDRHPPSLPLGPERAVEARRGSWLPGLILERLRCRCYELCDLTLVDSAAPARFRASRGLALAGAAGLRPRAAAGECRRRARHRARSVALSAALDRLVCVCVRAEGRLGGGGRSGRALFGVALSFSVRRPSTELCCCCARSTTCSPGRSSAGSSTAARRAMGALARHVALSSDVIVSGTDGHLREVNPAFTRILGYPRRRRRRQAVPRFRAPRRPGKVGRRSSARSSSGYGPITRFENRYRHRDGTLPLARMVDQHRPAA